MESISGNSNGNNLGGILLNQMQSNAALKKMSGETSAPASEGVGNVLQNFGDILKGQMANINNLQAQANDAIETYATGGEIELHNVILATEKADMALQLAMQVRNKMVTAYQEIMHMNI